MPLQRYMKKHHVLHATEARRVTSLRTAANESSSYKIFKKKPSSLSYLITLSREMGNS